MTQGTSRTNSLLRPIVPMPPDRGAELPAGATSLDMYGEQVRLAYRMAPTGLTATLINAGILVAVLWPGRDPTHLLLWFAVMAAVVTGRGFLVTRFNSIQPDSQDMPIWGKRALAGVTATALTWGATSLFLLPFHDLPRQMFLAFILAGMTAGAVSSLPPLPYAYPIYTLLTVLPFTVVIAWRGDTIHLIMSAVSLVFVATMLITARAVRSMIMESLKLRFRNYDLVENLAVAKDRLEATNRKMHAEINERLQAERTLSQSQQRLSLHVQQTPLAVIEWDTDFRVVDWNPAAERIFGYSRAEALGRHAVELVVPESDKAQVLSLWADLLAKRTVENSTHENLTKDGCRVTCEWYNTPLVDDGGQVIGVASLARDISEQLRIEKMKNEFVATVSHELRTPLTSIHGSLSLLAGGMAGQMPREAKPLLDIAASNSERLTHLINDLLDMEKIESGKMRFKRKIQPLMPLVEHALAAMEAYGRQFAVHFSLNRSEPRVWVNVDGDRLIQVLTNLLSNAVKFSPGGSPVEVTVRRQKGNVRIAVTDHGPGIPDAFRSQIFEKFTQADGSDRRKTGGTGLGLSICKAIVDSLGGNIGFITEMGRGTTFHVDLPEVPEARAGGSGN